MKIQNAKTFKNTSQTVVTIGTFDGVHIGHKAILDRINSTAKSKGLESLVLTFFPHPRMVLQQDSDIKLLNSLEERKQLLEESGIDNLVVKEFTKEFSRSTALEYVRDLLVNKLRAKHVIIGYDHRFGRNRNANIKDLIEFGETYGFTVEEINPQDIDEVIVSSTKIRTALSEGDVNKANNYLGYYFMMNCKIVKGKGLGRQINFPTANLQLIDDYKLIPSNGVYVVRAKLNENWVYGMMNIGINPTVSDGNQRHMEVHLFDFNQDVYGELIKIEFLTKVRKEVKFDTIDLLKKQLTADQEWSQTYLKNEDFI